jgi:beta-mannosidase
MLRNHPSLLAWCGGNEINPEREALPLERLAHVVGLEDPDRPWIPASPSDGDVHQWGVWHAYQDWSVLAGETAPLMSEFGMQALPCAESIAEMFPEGAPQSLADPRWESRMGQTRKLAFYAGNAPGLAAAISRTQRVQSAALQTGIEACRLRRAPMEAEAPEGAEDSHDYCGGVAFWQFDEPWPAVSWSVVDHAGRPKAAYAMLQRAYQPLLVAARFPRPAPGAGGLLPLEFWIVNDTPVGQANCRAEAHLDGRLVWSASGVDARPGAAARIGVAAIELDGSPERLELALLSPEGETLSRNCYDLGAPRPQSAPPRLAAYIHRLGMRLLGG